MPATRSDITSDDYYTVLGVDARASETEITKSYKKLALQYHPDKNRRRKDRAEEAFKKISEAYSTLCDPVKRSEYDRIRSGPPESNNTQRESWSSSRSNTCSSDPHRWSTENDGDRQYSGVFSMFTGGTKQVHQQRCPVNVLPIGTVVVLRNLEKTPNHNGRIGKIIGFDRTRTRYDVEVCPGIQLVVKPHNLTQQCDLEVVGLQTKKELNGQLGSIVDFDDRKGRYMVFVQDHPTAIALQPANCLLREGAHVILYGLEADAYNGQTACIVNIHRADGRYTVACQDGKEIKVKFGNAICYELSFESCANADGKVAQTMSMLPLYLCMMVPIAFFAFVMLILVIVSEPENKDL